jgi:hypothetical protein
MAGSPAADCLERIERRIVPRELREEDRRTLDAAVHQTRSVLRVPLSQNGESGK